MKKIILTAVFTISTICVFSQSQLNKSTFKNYQSCQDCFDNWKKDNGDLTQLKSTLNPTVTRTGNQMKSGTRRFVTFFVTTAVSIAGLTLADRMLTGYNSNKIKF